jgi:basic amino acid/polyamine antiporter, APA family
VGTVRLREPRKPGHPITLVSMALTTVGALALALLFAALSWRLPADGGPYASAYR